MSCRNPGNPQSQQHLTYIYIHLCGCPVMVFTVTPSRWHSVSTIKQSVCARPTSPPLWQRGPSHVTTFAKKSFLSQTTNFYPHAPRPPPHPHKHTLWAALADGASLQKSVDVSQKWKRKSLNCEKGEKKKTDSPPSCLPKCPCLRLCKQDSPGDSNNVKQT